MTAEAWMKNRLTRYPTKGASYGIHRWSMKDSLPLGRGGEEEQGGRLKDSLTAPGRSCDTSLKTLLVSLRHLFRDLPNVPLTPF